MSQQQSKECPLKDHEFLDITPSTSIDQIHKHYKECLLEEFKKKKEYELSALPSEDLYLWLKRDGGEKELMSTTYVMYEGKNFCCPDEFLFNRRFKTCTQYQIAEIIVMALEKQL